MSTSERIATTEWIPGCEMIGDTGGGVLAENIPTTGAWGGGYAADCVGPSDYGKEICGRITSWPVGLTLIPREDTSFDAWGPDGVYLITFDLYVDYVLLGAVTFPVTIGAGHATVAGQIMTIATSIVGGAAVGAGGASVAGQVLPVAVSVVPGAASSSNGTSVAGQVVAIPVSMVAGQASGSGGASVPGQIITVMTSIIPGAAVGDVFYVRAPDGGGYRPNQLYTVRPPTIWTKR